MSCFFNVKIRSCVAPLLLALFYAGCGGKGGGPAPTPVAQPPTIACPADITVDNVSGASQTVTYPDPVVTQGAAPVTTTCSPASGTDFALGTTAVSCTATDAQQRSATCSFNALVKGFTLGATIFEAFGDSLTAGEVGQPKFGLSIIDTPNAYPTRLQFALEQFYPGQGITVINRGQNGHKIQEIVDRIRALVRVDRPTAVLILGGFNDLTSPCGPDEFNTADCQDAIFHVGNDGVLDAIRKAKESSDSVKYVFVSTLTPPGPAGSLRIDRNAIVKVNGLIARAAASQRAVLVDSYAAFLGHEAEYVNLDGLHLRPAGYQALADAFFAAIRATIPQTPQLR